jgi:carbonic anhydrase
MARSDQLLQRNKDLEATCAHEEASIIARHQVYVITFLDPRTDSSAFVELDLGDAMEVRNAGGPVSADVLGDLPCTRYLVSAPVPGGPQFEIAVCTPSAATSSACAQPPSCEHDKHLRPRLRGHDRPSQPGE